MVLGTMEVMAESLTLANKAGVDSTVALDLLKGQSSKCPSKPMLLTLTAR